jgi:hypothetical protein
MAMIKMANAIEAAGQPGRVKGALRQLHRGRLGGAGSKGVYRDNLTPVTGEPFSSD